MAYYLVTFLVVILDQVTKWLVVKYMELGESIPLINDFLYFTSHRNKGAAWGILQGQLWLFYIVSVFVIFFIIYYMEKHGKGKVLYSLSLALMLGGAAGNLLDRIFRKEVVDFIDVYIFSYDFPIFNVADSALVIGVILFSIVILAEERHAKRVAQNGDKGNNNNG